MKTATDRTLEAIFVDQVRQIDGGLASVVQQHLNAGHPLAKVRAILTDGMSEVRSMRAAA